MSRKLYLILLSLFLGILSSVFIKLPVLAADLSVAGISPNSGPATGGTLVTISGIGFVDEVVASVTIGGISIGFSVTNDTTLTATTPANSAGPADITVTTSSDSVTLSNGFTYYAVPVPTVTTITPNSGPTTGNTTVTISGTGFYGGGSSSTVSSIAVGGSPAAGVSVISDSSLSVTTPAGSAGTVDVVVTTSGGSGTLSGGYTYYVPPVPTVTSIVPNSGPTTGNTPVTISGTGFYGGGSSSAVSSVTVGGNPAAGVSVTSDTTLTATTLTGSAGTVDVVVNTSGGSATLTNGFTYYAVPVPTITSITPNSGPTTGNTTVTISGTGFYGGGSSSAVSSVTVGGNPAAGVSVTSDTTLTATTPTGSAGIVDVVVNTSGGSGTLSSGYRYIAAPTITGISPGSGLASGGTTVTITGTNLTGATGVNFGSNAGTITGNSATQITVTSPAGSGTVDVTVITPGGTSATSSADRFTYTAAPIVTSISPVGGPLAGGTTLTINGTNFTGATAVHFGITSATPTVNSDTQITVTSPAGSGTVDVTVITPGGTSATSSADRFTYAPAPTVISVAPSSGPLAGGTSITISGNGFMNGASVTIGGTTAASSFVSATSLTATTPTGTAGAKSVVVTNPDTQTSNTNITFTYAAAPTVTSITPNAGITAGGTTVTIIGTGFYGGGSTSAVSAVKFGSSNAASYTVNSDTRISAVTPPDTAHTVNVVITTSGGDGTLNNGYTYADAPTSTTTTPITTTPSTTTTSTTTTTTAPAVTTTTSTTTTQTTTTSASAITTTPSTPITTSTRPITSATPVITTHPAAFAPSNLIINPGKVKPGEKVNISIKMTNNGDITGTDEISLKVNNLIVESKDITLAGGESAVVTFTTNSTSTGKYTIALAGLNDNFTVSNSTMPGWLWPSAIGAFTLGITLAVGFGLLRKAKI